MTPEDLSMLRAQIALLKTPSPTKGASRRYGEEELKAAIVGMGARLAESTFRNPIPRRAA